MRVPSRVAVASLVAACAVLAACRGGVKSGLRAGERADVPPPVAAAPSLPPREASPAARPQVWRIEYYKISDG